MAKKVKVSTPEVVAPGKELVELLRNDELHKDHPVTMSVAHAAKVLSIQEKKGWKHYSLPQNSKYTFKDGSLIRSASETTDTGTSAQ